MDYNQSLMLNYACTEHHKYDRLVEHSSEPSADSWIERYVDPCHSQPRFRTLQAIENRININLIKN